MAKKYVKRIKDRSPGAKERRAALRASNRIEHAHSMALKSLQRIPPDERDEETTAIIQLLIGPLFVRTQAPGGLVR